ncbi:hypothetical protein [Hymenobacter metallicola]|uniref:Type VI secretion system baseplate subunit TssK n=1 Tax=Hymenobacter metallicola TaxID=2563114 RepID=A0A4Z0QJL5_9BACT|nr:hypothetical protein [Hymenobacter metallicola]TGE29469.1 hypothetical protein E5K02_08450 [Hymenobacter metallicola]
MLPEIKHYPVNWVDGMKISRRHFTELEQFTTEHLRDATALSLTAHRYGLLPADPQGLSSFELLLSVDHQQAVTARLTNCRAVTAGGARIEITGGSEPLTYRTSLAQLLSDFNLTATEQLRFHVVVSVNPYVRIPAGAPAPEEIPPRHPYTTPEYQLSVVPALQLTSTQVSSFHLVVGELVHAEGALRPVAQFIPPSMALVSHPALLKWLHQTEHLLQEIETEAFRVIQKVRMRVDKKNNLSELVHLVAERLVTALAQELPGLAFTAAEQPPVVLQGALMRLAKQFRTSLYCLTEAEREELLKYFEQWSEILPATLLNALNEAVTARYEPLRVHDSLQQYYGLWQLVATIFRQLSQLEYIGKNKEGWKTFINENPVAASAAPEKPATRWNPF